MIYEFRCLTKHVYTEHRVVADMDKRSKCPQCGKAGKRVISPVQPVFKGTGFPSHDNRKRPFPLD